MEFDNEAVEAIKKDDIAIEQDSVAMEQGEATAEQAKTAMEQEGAAPESGETMAVPSETAAASDEAVAESDETATQQDEAAILNQAKLTIAEKVRNASKDLHKLAAVETFAELMPENQGERVSAVISGMIESSEYPDLKSVIAPNGKTFLYSDKYITQQYANMLSRVETDDKGTTIAMTVRDDSRIYPRLTHLEFFQAKLFNIGEEEFDACIAHMLEQEEFKDIKLLVASTGAQYLYSNLYINEFYAGSLAEWEEVGKKENP